MPRKPDAGIRSTTHLGIVRETGEVVDVEMPVLRGRKRRGKKRVYGLTDLESIARLRLHAAEWTVLNRIMAGLNGETNESSVTHALLADECGMARPNISRIMKTLTERRIIIPVRYGVYRVNPWIVYRGSNDDWTIATEPEEEPVWQL